MNDIDTSYASPSSIAVPPLPARDAVSLKPKGACWYCNAPLDNIRRFCNKTCAEDYLTEEETFKPIIG